MSELKPCPFCGGDAKVVTTHDESIWSHETVPYTCVYCPVCEISTENTCKGYEPDAIAAWNRRTPAEPIARVVGYINGRPVIEPLNRATVLPVGMALYAKGGE